MRTTDMADELFRGPETELPAGVRLATAKRGGVTVTRVEIAREGLARPRGRYVTLEMPSVSVLDERDTDVIETGGSRAAGPAAAGRPGAGAGHRQPAGDGGRSWPPHSPEDPGHHGAAAYPAGAGHPAGGGTGPRRVRRHRADPAAAGGGHGRRSAARSPDLCGQSLQCGGCPAGPHHPVFRHRPAPGGCPTRPASGRRSPGRTGDRGGHPHPDGRRRGGRPGAHAPCAGQRHRSRVGAAGGAS